MAGVRTLDLLIRKNVQKSYILPQDHGALARLAVRSKNQKAEMKGRQKTSVQNVHQYQIYTKADYTPR